VNVIHSGYIAGAEKHHADSSVASPKAQNSSVVLFKGLYSEKDFEQLLIDFS
jgi:hypothetical protein